jgi:DNA-directed RNA polymerase specialized sigma subunit
MTKKKKTTNNTVSESEFLQVLENITKRLAHKFRFGYHDIEDMKQQAAIFALEGLERYDNARPLENFLWTHVRNRLFNYKRNNYQRPDKPCLNCPLYDPQYIKSTNQCSKFTNKHDCEPYNVWAERNIAKKNIMQPSYIDYDIAHSNSFDNIIQNDEIIKFLDANIHSDFREYYLRLRHGEKIPKQQLKKLQAHIKNIMENFHCQTDQEFPKNEDN